MSKYKNERWEKCEKKTLFFPILTLNNVITCQTSQTDVCYMSVYAQEPKIRIRLPDIRICRTRNQYFHY
jgi:hypothetical protein